MYLIGEALIGDGAEVAHIDLLMGDKEGPIGTAFAHAVSQLSAGHTPLLAVDSPQPAHKTGYPRYPESHA